MKSEVYLIPTYRCNINCPHCQITQKHSNEDFEKFLDSYRSINGIAETVNENISYVLFGGEPLVNGFEKVRKIIEFGKQINKPICTTTSNLLLLNDDFLKLFIDNDIIIGTSWNPHRFTYEQQELWFKNIEKIAETGTNVALFVTLTYDLFRSNLFEIMDRLDVIGNVASVTFNPYIPGSPTLREKTDEYLCKLDDVWRWKIRFILREALIQRHTTANSQALKCHSCSGVACIEPDGNIKNGCAHEGVEHMYFDECDTCKYRFICLSKKCPKQPYCNFFFKFYNQVLKKYPLANLDMTQQNKIKQTYDARIGIFNC